MGSKKYALDSLPDNHHVVFLNTVYKILHLTFIQYQEQPNVISKTQTRQIKQREKNVSFLQDSFLDGLITLDIRACRWNGVWCDRRNATPDGGGKKTRMSWLVPVALWLCVTLSHAKGKGEKDELSGPSMCGSGMSHKYVYAQWYRLRQPSIVWSRSSLEDINTLSINTHSLRREWLSCSVPVFADQWSTKTPDGRRRTATSCTPEMSPNNTALQHETGSLNEMKSVFICPCVLSNTYIWAQWCCGEHSSLTAKWFRGLF